MSVTADASWKVNPYHRIVESRVRSAFSALSRQDASPSLALMHDQVVYTFDETDRRHALAGTRTSRDAVELWFGRLFRLLPGEFVIRKVDVEGWPWLTKVRVHFEDTVTPKLGRFYVNQGYQDVELRWGKAVRIHTHVQSEKLESALKILGEGGILEATLPPIE